MAWSSTRMKWVFMFVPLFLFHLAFTTATEDGLVPNGDFEASPSNGFPNEAIVEGPIEVPNWKSNGTVELVESGQKQGGMILIVPQGRHAVRIGNDAEISQELPTIDLQTLYNVQGWNPYAVSFNADEDSFKLVFKNPGMEDDPTCGPIIDNIAIKKLFTPDKPKDNAVINGDFEEGPWMFRNTSMGVLLPTNLDEETSSLPGWIVESNRAVRYIDSDHYAIPQGRRAIELLSGKEGIISQMVETKPEKPYTLTFSLGHADDKCKEPLAVMAFAGDQTQNIHYTPNSNSTFQVSNLNFTAKADMTRIAFYSVYYNTRSDDMTSLCGPVVDDVRVWFSRSSRLRGLGFVRLGLGILGLVLVLV
ncbi:unnamed protein product [Vicia faba]|uniref:DUF642 domain-containing protein n=1 Tax=Vicia faba TaxID=3906 RepID=A0AAV0YXA8_VICFA|nr:unnamed protein product [Vicia faba]